MLVTMTPRAGTWASRRKSGVSARRVSSEPTSATKSRRLRPTAVSDGLTRLCQRVAAPQKPLVTACFRGLVLDAAANVIDRSAGGHLGVEAVEQQLGVAQPDGGDRPWHH